MSLSKTVPLKDYNTHFALYRAKDMNKVKNTVESGEFVLSVVIVSESVRWN